MSDIRKYISLIESAMAQPKFSGKELFTESMSVNFASHGLTEQQLIENRIQWLRDNVMGELEPIADKENRSVEDVFNWIIEQDPSKNNQYSQWLMKIISSKKSKSSLKDLENAKDILSKYDIMKKDKILKPEHKDLNRFKSIEELANAIDATEKRVTSEKDAVEKKARDESKIISEDSVWLVVIPETEYAAGYWGKETLWCTSSGFEGGRQEDRTENHFDRYHENGELIILYNKKNSKNTYQFHILRNEFTNSEDEMIKDGRKRRKIFDHFPRLKEYVYSKITDSGDYLWKVVNMFPTDDEEEIKKFITTPEQAFQYAKGHESVQSEYIENLLKQDDELYVIYVVDILQEPLQSLDRLLKYPEYAFKYAVEVSQERYDLDTEIYLYDNYNIKHIDTHGRLYLRTFVKNTDSERLREAIASSSSAMTFAMNILRGRFPEHEEFLNSLPSNDRRFGIYINFITDSVPFDEFAKSMKELDIINKLDGLSNADRQRVVRKIVGVISVNPDTITQEEFEKFIDNIGDEPITGMVDDLLHLGDDFTFNEDFYKKISRIISQPSYDDMPVTVKDGILDQLELQLSEAELLEERSDREYVNTIDFSGVPMQTLLRIMGLLHQRTNKTIHYIETLFVNVMSYGNDDVFYKPQGVLEMFLVRLPDYAEKLNQQKLLYIERMRDKVDGDTLDTIIEDLNIDD